MEGIKNTKVSKVGEKDTVLLHGILKNINTKDEQVADGELRDDEKKVEREFGECYDVPPINSTQARLEFVIEAHSGDEQGHLANHEGIETSPT